MSFETFVHYVNSPLPPPPQPPPPKKIFLHLDSLSIFKKITYTESSWQIIQIRNPRDGGGGGEVWGSGAVGEGVESDLFY